MQNNQQPAQFGPTVDIKVDVPLEGMILREGEVNGYKFHHLIVTTIDGIILKAKLSDFEYRVMKDNYGKVTTAAN